MGGSEGIQEIRKKYHPNYNMASLNTSFDWANLGFVDPSLRFLKETNHLMDEGTYSTEMVKTDMILDIQANNKKGRKPEDIFNDLKECL